MASSFEEHPTARAVRNGSSRVLPERLSAAWIRKICLQAGADDVGFVSIHRTELDDQRADILKAFPRDSNADQSRFPHEQRNCGSNSNDP